MLAVSMSGFVLKNTRLEEKEETIFKMIVMCVDRNGKLTKIPVKVYGELAYECYSNVVEGTFVEITGTLEGVDKLCVVAQEIEYRQPTDKRFVTMTKSEFLKAYKPTTFIKKIIEEEV